MESDELTTRQDCIASPSSELAPTRSSRLSCAALGALLAYIVVREAADPGFTAYWGYMVGQITVILVCLSVVDRWFRRDGGLSWYTQLVTAGATWVDALGNAAHLYERHASYDKVTHFCAGVAITAAIADILRILDERGVITMELQTRLATAVALTLLINIGWELYEYFADGLFQTTRHQGTLDTLYDFVSDLSGAFASTLLLVRLEATPRTAERPIAMDGVQA